ncbi:uncharacterized protein LOC133834704 [Humulus lupulus]|uniref:uncharacterized protein LOC133834704 n=1 Tax=Humulus lupulus TaxID=3486 RepID=UPI002B40E089|nr:uncharacterized protein LOC133834704 [Humulus lupulus]
MSGGVGPTYNDVNLPREQENKSSRAQASFNGKRHSTPKKIMFLSFRHLSALAVALVLSASGMVSPQDWLFVLFSIVYSYFLFKFAFPKLLSSPEPPVFSQTKNFLIYLYTGAVIGLLLPIAYILDGIFEGDREGIKAAAPHLFLLCSQVFMEGVVFSAWFSIPIQVFVPIFYNSRRIFSIIDWLRNEFSKVNEGYGGSTRRLYIGRGLAIASMAFWCFNLFCFLLPVYLPRAFKRYYSAYKVKD